MNEESLFYLALQQPDAAARAAFLDQACADQPQLRARLEKLLQAHDVPVALFDQPAVDPGATSDHVAPGAPGNGASTGGCSKKSPTLGWAARSRSTRRRSSASLRQASSK